MTSWILKSLLDLVIKWYHYYLVVVELVWARNFCDGYDIYVYNNEFLDEHLATFKVDFVIKYNNGFNYVPRIQTHYLKEEDVAWQLKSFPK